MNAEPRGHEKQRDAARGALAEGWFDRSGGDVRLSPLGDGHINDTWLVTSPQGRFVLQRVNPQVFPEPCAVMGKVADVVDHLQRRGDVAVPSLVPGRNGVAWLEDPRGSVWRLWSWVAGRSLQRLENPLQAEAAGRAFGRFQLALAGLPVNVPDPIPGFMQLSGYLAELDAAVAAAADPSATATLLRMIDLRRDLAGLFGKRDRLVHGDCKVNNLVFAENRDEVVCVIDLDTVMVGHWAWDFGDLVRSALADGNDISIERYAGVVRGFVGSGAVPRDLEALVLAPRYVALMLGARFLTDHLRGDRYFKVSAAGENLVRARQQLELLAAIEQRSANMREVAARA